MLTNCKVCYFDFVDKNQSIIYMPMPALLVIMPLFIKFTFSECLFRTTEMLEKFEIVYTFLENKNKL